MRSFVPGHPCVHTHALDCPLSVDISLWFIITFSNGFLFFLVTFLLLGTITSNQQDYFELTGWAWALGEYELCVEISRVGWCRKSRSNPQLTSDPACNNVASLININYSMLTHSFYTLTDTTPFLCKNSALIVHKKVENFKPKMSTEIGSTSHWC